MVNEMFTLAAHKNVEKGLPGFRLQQWYLFSVAVFFGYGYMLKNNLLVEVAENDWLPSVIGKRPAAPMHPLPHARGHNPTCRAIWGRLNRRTLRASRQRDRLRVCRLYTLLSRCLRVHCDAQ